MLSEPQRCSLRTGAPLKSSLRQCKIGSGVAIDRTQVIHKLLRAFDVKGAQQLMDALSAVNRHSRPDFALAQAAFQRCASAKTAPLWLTQHPYPRTLLMALLIEA